jgi:hypothetical protein
MSEGTKNPTDTPMDGADEMPESTDDTMPMPAGGDKEKSMETAKPMRGDMDDSADDDMPEPTGDDMGDSTRMP